MATTTSESAFEQRLSDAFYTAVGLGVFAYRSSEPHVKRFQEQVERDLAARRNEGRSSAETIVSDIKTNVCDPLAKTVGDLFKRPEDR